jgi:hypothetical protein
MAAPPFKDEDEAADWVSRFMAKGQQKKEQARTESGLPTCGNCAFIGPAQDPNTSTGLSYGYYWCFSEPPRVISTKESGRQTVRPYVKTQDQPCRHHKKASQ